MKTITEFSGFVLKDAMTKKAGLLAEGKSEEEAQTAINEQLKLDEAKGVLYKNVVDMTSSRADRVKRVVVAVKASDTEKVPEAYMEREGHFYLIEYYPDANSRAPSRTSSFGDDRNSRGGSGRGGSGRGGERSGRGGGGNNREGGGFGGGSSFGDRKPRESFGDRPFQSDRAPAPEIPRPEGQFNLTRAGEPNPPPAPRAPREKRAPKPRSAENAGADRNANRQPRAPRGPKGVGELRLVLKDQSQRTLAGSAEAETQTATDGMQAVPASATDSPSAAQ